MQDLIFARARETSRRAEEEVSRTTLRRAAKHTSTLRPEATADCSGQQSSEVTSRNSELRLPRRGCRTSARDQRHDTRCVSFDFKECGGAFYPIWKQMLTAPSWMRSTARCGGWIRKQSCAARRWRMGICSQGASLGSLSGQREVRGTAAWRSADRWRRPPPAPLCGR